MKNAQIISEIKGKNVHIDA